MATPALHLSIEAWLEKLDLTIYRSLFLDYHGVEDILWMSERDLKNIGINNGGHRARISTSLSFLKDKYNKSFGGKDGMDIEGNILQKTNANKSFNSISPVHCLNVEKHHSGVRSWPSSGQASAHSTKTSSPRSNIDGYAGTDATAEDLKRALEKELSLDGSDLRSYAWYHGTILRQRAENLMSQDGDFLVRDCISQPGDFVITCKWAGLALHFIIKKIILQPDTVYERIQYCFEGYSFDSIPDFITFYVGSKCPLSLSSGAIISRPINRTMPLSYYASRYGIQCQIHYAAKALEKIPPVSLSCDNSPNRQSVPVRKTEKAPNPAIPSELNKNSIHAENIQNMLQNKEVKNIKKLGHTLTRVGSDPMLSPNTERRRLENRPNSVSFSSSSDQSCTLKDEKPPPKPSRVPSVKLAQKPIVAIRNRTISIDEVIEESQEGIPIRAASLAHRFQRQISETRFSFLDRPSVSDDGSTASDNHIFEEFTVPELNPPSAFQPQMFQTVLLSAENAPLEGSVLQKVKEMLLTTPSKIIAYHLTRIDLEIAKNFHDTDLGAGVTNGLELLLLPQGEQLRNDLKERTECMKLFVSVIILTTPVEEERVELLSKWIEIAIETKTSTGNFYGFSSIMLALTLPEIAELHSTWLALRHSHTEVAFVFETKLKPLFKALENATDIDVPNICIPYLLSLIFILQKHGELMTFIDVQPFDNETISKNMLDFYLPGGQIADDYGLQLLADHLELGRNIMQNYQMFNKNGQMFSKSHKYDNALLDVFHTEFHLRMLWGYRGCIVACDERYQKFLKVLNFFHNKCNETASE
ncbi:breast cancer anti-estrogen resistance protein 3 homolog [Uloborus diversus]|uniref:breast cancer anti-estrogen resistance protein 3 homolog n=1 Tax=Uloborus diversus TaxID=327109 RepID=UPI0024093806|nr:breast cancer anti-estrogen resistance protein 3 homolog [Uloborus diversus]